MILLTKWLNCLIKAKCICECSHYFCVNSTFLSVSTDVFGYSGAAGTSTNTSLLFTLPAFFRPPGKYATNIKWSSSSILVSNNFWGNQTKPKQWRCRMENKNNKLKESKAPHGWEEPQLGVVMRFITATPQSSLHPWELGHMVQRESPLKAESVSSCWTTLQLWMLLQRCFKF